MANTYTLISSNVLASSAASVTFSAIPSTYTDLVLRISARSDTAGTSDQYYVTFNGSGTGYSYTNLYGTGAAAATLTISAQAIIRVRSFDGNTATANTYGSAEIYIPSYTATQNKPISAFAAMEDNATAAIVGTTAGLWSNTAAITSVTISAAGANWLAGSSFYLYGISKS